jgi:hypothetical protein
MLNFLLFLIGCLGVWKTGQYASTFIEEQWLLDPQRRKLQAKFEAWWITVADMKPQSFAVALARGASDVLSSFFGKRLFSKRAFSRAAAIGTGLLMTSLVFTNFMGIGVKPWAEFDTTIQVLKDAPSRFKPNRGSIQDKATTEALEKIKAVAESYGGWHWKIFYCVSFFLIITAANAVSFFLSVALSRLILQEIVAAGRFFSACTLLALDLILIVCTATLFLLFASVLAYPGLWFFLPAVYLLSRASILFLFVFLFGGGLAAWAFGNPALQIASWIAIVPCLGAALICVLSSLALLNRERFHLICSGILLRCAEKKPLSFIAGFIGGIAVLIALICRLIHVL